MEGSGWRMLSSASVLGAAPHQHPCLCITAWRDVLDRIPRLQTLKYQISATKAFPNDGSMINSEFSPCPWVGKGSPVVVERTPGRFCAVEPPPEPNPVGTAVCQDTLGSHLRNADGRNGSPSLHLCQSLGKQERCCGPCSSSPTLTPWRCRMYRTRT